MSNQSDHLRHASEIAHAISSMASSLLHSERPLLSPAALYTLNRAYKCPVEYMRYAEFEAVAREMLILDGMCILDVGSPQWYVLYLASKYPRSNFVYLNILADEIYVFELIAQALNLENIRFIVGDVRKLPLSSSSFDLVYSISVIEHIFPECGGDLTALKEIARVIKPSGFLTLTLPCKDRASIVYSEGPVYEREESGSNFFAREYDEAQFMHLIACSGFICNSLWYICERQGAFAIDYWEWGPGKNSPFMPFFGRFRSLLENRLGINLERLFAHRYLTVSRQRQHRLVNLAASLKLQVFPA